MCINNTNFKLSTPKRGLPIKDLGSLWGKAARGVYIPPLFNRRLTQEVAQPNLL